MAKMPIAVLGIDLGKNSCSVAGLDVNGGGGVLAYAAYGLSGHADYTGPTTAGPLGNKVAGSSFTGKYDGLSFGNGGVALTYAGFTIGGNIIGGRISGVLGRTASAN